MAETHEDLSHRVFVHLIGAVEDDDRESDSTAEIFSGFCLSSSSWSGRRSSHDQVQGLGEGDVASISEWSDHQTESVSDVLV